MKRRLTLLAVVLLVAGAATLDRLAPAMAPKLRSSTLTIDAGVLTCPLASDGVARGYVHLANVGAEPARTRISIVPTRGRAVVLRRTVGASTATTVSLRKRTKAGMVPLVSGAAAAVIEYSGGRLVASHSLWGSRQHTTASACAHTASGDLIVPHLRTYKATSTLWLFNPGRADAGLSITLLADGKVLIPQGLTRLVVRGGGLRRFPLGNFAFDTRDLTAVIRVRSGRVVAEAAVRSAGGWSMVGGVSAARDLVSIAAKSGPASSISIADPGEDPTGVDTRLMSATTQGSGPSIPPAIDALTGLRRSIPLRDRGGPVAYAIAVGEGPLVAAGTTWFRKTPVGSDFAAVEAVSPATQWGGVIGSIYPRARLRAIIANPGDQPAAVHVRRLTPTGTVETDEIIEAGRLITISLGSGTGTFAIEVTATAGVALALDGQARPLRVTSRTRGFASFSVAGTDLSPPPPVAVSIDPRAAGPLAS